MLYGYITTQFMHDFKPKILLDIYPRMKDPQIINFSYFELKGVSWLIILLGSLKVSFVAVLETLISARIADRRTGTRFDQSKEVFGLSIANVLTGAMGGTPCTGVLVRTSVNIETGATSKISQFINAMIVLFVVLVFMPVFVYTPMICIAAILVTSSFRLMPIKVIKELYSLDKAELVVLIVTAAVCLLIDGAVGLLVGAIISIMRSAIKSQEIEMCSVVEKNNKVYINVSGQLNYITATSCETEMINAIVNIEHSKLNKILNLEKVTVIDVDGIDALKTALGRNKFECKVSVMIGSKMN